MALAQVIAAVVAFFETVMGKKGQVIEITAIDDGWNALVETIEEIEYMRKIAQDDMIAVYEVHVDKNFEIVGYSRKSMRSRKQAA